MHEESLTRALLSQVIAVADANHATRVQQIEVSCGGLSGVEPLLLQEAFQRIQTEYECCRNAVLSIHDPGLPAQCRDCRTTFQIQDFRFRCPVCSSSALQVLDGDCLKLLNVSLQLPEEVISEPISGTAL
jgi:hydrogenase nickel incorporation protein HypA/HybF